MNWEENNKFLERNFIFKTFMQAMDFINKVAKIAEELNHHPEISLHNYNEVMIQTTTHSEKKITQKDYNLAKQIDLL